MREKIKDEGRLLHMMEAILNLEEFTAGVSLEDYSSNKILKFAIIKNLEIVGEAAYMVSPEFKKLHLEVEWEVVVKMRHVLVHGYYQIRDEIVWSVIEDDLQPLKYQIEAILASSSIPLPLH